MPPKATGTGRPRGRPRGSGRGGRGGRRIIEEDDTTSNSTATADSETIADSQMEEAPSQPAPIAPMEASSAGQEAEAMDVDPASSDTVIGSHEAAAEGAEIARTPVQRLESLSRSNRPSPVASGRGRGALKIQPKNTSRRSKEERDAAAALEAERKKARMAAAAEAPGLSSSRGNFRGRGDRGGARGGRGRGGFMGGPVASGPFSGGIVRADTGRHVQGPRMGWGGGGGGGGGGGHGGSRGVKREPGVKVDPDGEGNMTGEVQQEDGGYISSDPEDEVAAPRVDVDFLDLTSDGPTPMAHALLPLRIHRVEHKDRVMTMNTEASSAKSAELKKRAEEGRETAEEAQAGSGAGRKGKGKAKAKDVEFVRDERRWKGVYQSDSDNEQPRIKPEPGEEALDVEDIPEAVPPLSPESQKKIKSSPSKRRRKSYRGEKPVLQTEEEKQEWERRQFDLQELAYELGTVKTLKADTQEQDEEPQTQQPTEAEPATIGDERARDRENRVYLFQFPPVVPDLMYSSDAVKKEPSSPTLARAEPAAVVPPPPDNTLHAPIKIEDDAPDADEANPHKPKLASGIAGKLRIHESGKATLSWGGTSLELHTGSEAVFFQDTNFVRIIPEAERDRNVGGEVFSFGQVRGKFVVTPDWEEIVG